jgi:hypothetical protein
MIPVRNLLALSMHSLAAKRQQGHPLWPGARFTDADRARATYRGLGFLYRTALNPRHFAVYGADLLWSFYTIATSVGDPTLRRMARQMGAERARRWRFSHLRVPHKATADAVIAICCGHDAATALGVPDETLIPHLRRAASRYSAIDFLKFDPLREPPPSDVPEECTYDKADNLRGSTVCRQCQRPLTFRSRYDVWYDALTTTHSGDRCGVKLGAHYADVFRWLPSMRPYPGSENGVNTIFEDAVYAITHIVYTLNDYNTTRLDPDWLPEEYAFLQASLQQAIAEKDEDMLGEIMDGLRAFGITNDDEKMRAGMEYLLADQNANGSWGNPADQDIYSLYHPTWCAVTALSEIAAQEVGSRLDLTPYAAGISLADPSSVR